MGIPWVSPAGGAGKIGTWLIETSAGKA
jgi:hypothetical protein